MVSSCVFHLAIFQIHALSKGFTNASSAYKVYSATLRPLSSSGVSGQVTIFISSSSLLGVGSATGLETSLKSTSKGGTDCTAVNGCGTHVHRGTACTDATTQGDHLFSGTSDPWTTVMYKSTSNTGGASFDFAVSAGVSSIFGKPFIIHNNAGGRVACGLLLEVTSHVSFANLKELSSSGVTGSVTIHAVSNTVIGAGSASGLEPSLSDSTHGGSNCTATNGCGVHVHSGTTCTNTRTQGVHYYTGQVDPWIDIRYSSTDASGRASFVFSVQGPTQIDGKAFIVHDDAGGRVSCGLLQGTKKIGQVASFAFRSHFFSTFLWLPCLPSMYGLGLTGK